MANLGWHYLGKNKKDIAMKRFNQCWLLNKKKYKCYWGFGALYYLKFGPDSAIKYYSLGSQYNSNDVDFNMDLAIAYIQIIIASKGTDSGAINSVDSLLKQQHLIDSTNQKYSCIGTEIKAKMGQMEEACQLSKLCIDPKYSDGIPKECF